MIGVTPDTRGRGTGGTERQKRKVREMRKTEPIWFSRIQWYHWRAVCIERCKHRFGGGRLEKDWALEIDKSSLPQYLANRLSYNIGLEAANVLGKRVWSAGPGRRSPLSL